jgi:hypothetical protein
MGTGVDVAASRRLRFLPLLIAAGVISFGDRRLGACSCAPISPCQAAWAAGLVFVGKVEAIDRLEPRSSHPPLFYDRRVRFRVQERLIGHFAGDAVEIFTHGQSATCGYPFAANGTYLVYAGRQPRTGELTTSICSRTKPLSGAGGEIRDLRNLVSSESAVGRLRGAVSRRLPDDSRRRPVAGAAVTLASTSDAESRRLSFVTDNEGRFALDAPSGEYTVTVALPPDLWTREVTVMLLDRRACRELPIVAEPNGRIAGRVVDARGAPVPFLHIEASEPDRARDRHAPASSSALTDADGVFEIARLRPSTYALGLQLSRFNGSPPGAVWLPTGDAASAAAFKLGFGERVDVHDVALPTDVIPVLVQGSIVDPDGRPMPDDAVSLSINDGWSWEGINTIPLDAASKFKLSLIAGRRYRLRFSKAFGTTFRQIEVAEFVAARDLSPLDLRFPR